MFQFLAWISIYSDNDFNNNFHFTCTQVFGPQLLRIHCSFRLEILSCQRSHRRYSSSIRFCRRSANHQTSLQCLLDEWGMSEKQKFVRTWSILLCHSQTNEKYRHMNQIEKINNNYSTPWWVLSWGQAHGEKPWRSYFLS